MFGAKLTSFLEK